MNKHFEIDLSKRMKLSDQLTDGLRRSILSGRYSPGSLLPSLRVLSETYGVSMIVAREAYRRLADEGLVTTRPRIGCLVAPRKAKLWRGVVVLVARSEDGSFYCNAFADGLRDELAKAGYLLILVHLNREASGALDFSPLDFVLGGSVTLVVQFFHDKDVSRFLKKKHVPFVNVGWTPVSETGAVGCVTFDFSAAIGSLAQAAERQSIRKVLQIGIERHPWTAEPFADSGISVREILVHPLPNCGVAEGATRAAVSFFENALAGCRPLPELIYFTDDYVAQGALLALAHHGVDIPGRIKIVSFANKGLGPVWWKELTRVEFDPAVHARTFAKAALECLSGGKFPPGVRLAAEFCPGESF